MNLRPADLAMFDKLRIPADLVELAGIERVTNHDARETYGIKGGGDMAGILFPYFDPESMANGRRRTYIRIRRDYPEMEDGKARKKYVSPYGDPKHFYFPPCPELFADTSVPIVLVEAEKSALALLAWSRRVGRKLLPLAMGGCWGWRGKVGIQETAAGDRVPEHGAIRDLNICRDGRLTYILLDTNCATNPAVGTARKELSRQLRKQKAEVRIVALPVDHHVNGPDDFISVHGDEALAQLFERGSTDWRALFHTYEESLNAPPVKFAIPGFLQQDAITGIGGLAGHGKTLVMLSMARVLLEGGPLFNYFPFEVSELSRRVLYLIPESGLGPFVHRLKLFNLLDQVRQERLFYRTLNSKDPMMSLADPRLLEAAEGADVFLDTAIRFMEGDENSASDHRRFAQVLFNLQQVGATTITAAHHSPKNLGHANFLSLENVLRGSGDMGAMVASCWGVYQQDPESNTIVVKNVKARDFAPCSEFRIQGRPYIDERGHFQIIQMPGEGEEFNPQQDRGKKGGRPATPDKADKLAKAQKLIDAGKTVEDAAASVGVSRRTLFNWIGEGKKGVQ